jgi:hypothetical protein
MSLRWWVPAALLLVLAGLLWPGQYLAVSNGETGEVYHRPEVREGSVVRVSWTHSIEKTPWVETYEVSDGRFLLREARVKSLGAGVDQLAPEARVEDGWVVLSGTGRSFPELRFFHSRGVERRLEVDGRPLDLEGVPQYAPVEVDVRSGPRVAAWISGRSRGEGE